METVYLAAQDVDLLITESDVNLILLEFNPTEHVVPVKGPPDTGKTSPKSNSGSSLAASRRGSIGQRSSGGSSGGR